MRTWIESVDKWGWARKATIDFMISNNVSFLGNLVSLINDGELSYQTENDKAKMKELERNG